MASTLATTSSDRLDLKFAELRSAGRKALVCYVTAGYPDYAQSLDLICGLEDAGADVIEVGVPFSDPIADGPVIQESSHRALALGMNLDRTLDLVTDARSEIPIVLFSYLNPILSAGPDVLERSRSAGVDGILVTDLPLGADPSRETWLASSGLAFIRLVAPTTPLERMREIALKGSGFVYLISRMGVTGEQKMVNPELAATASRLRSVTELPICIGFGISEASQARETARMADGIVVGSAIVRESGVDIARAISLTKSFRAALDG